MRTIGLVVLTLIAMLPVARAETLIAWTLDGCATQRDDQLILQSCSLDCPSDSSASASCVITAPGQLKLRLDWTVLGNPTADTGLFVRVDGHPFLSLQPEGDWCAPAPCTGQQVFEIPVMPTQVITLELSKPGSCPGAGGLVCRFTVEFLPDIGFTPGFGEADSRLISTAQGDDAYDELGHGLAFLNDLDGDGGADLALGSLSNEVRFVSGATGAELFSVTAPPGADPGFAGTLASVGDVNGDGLEDLVVGYTMPVISNGPAHVFSGADGQPLLEIAATTFELFADAVSGVGDVDLDGVPDVLVGAPLGDVHGTNTGAARVYSGTDGALLLEVGGAPGDFAGTSLAGPGDLDGDGVPDLVVGARLANYLAPLSGVVRVHSGATGALLHALTGAADIGLFGEVLSAPGDVDADGVPDVVASSPDEAVVRAFSGATGQPLFQLDGYQEDGLGASLAPAGDWDDDGHADVIVGSRFHGFALVVSGATHATLAAIAHDKPYSYFGESDASNGSSFGSSSAGGGDANGDGRADFAVAAVEYEQGLVGVPQDIGKVYVYSGTSADWVPPSLTGTGALLPSTPVTLAIGGGDSFAQAFLVVGASAQPVAFKTGVLVPTVDLLVPLALDGAGSVALQGAWPPGIPPGTVLWSQAWLPDDDGFAGWFASPSMAIVAP